MHIVPHQQGWAIKYPSGNDAVNLEKKDGWQESQVNVFLSLIEKVYNTANEEAYNKGYRDGKDEAERYTE